MKKIKKKKSKPKGESKLSAGVEPKLEELINGIENEIMTAQSLKLDDTIDFAETEDRVDIGRHICIALGDTQLAIPLVAVLEAGDHLPVQPLPLLPDWITGITNIRGEIISVVNLNLFFDIKSSKQGTQHIPSDTNKPYLVVHNEGMKLAITVDKILATRPLYALANKKFENTRKKDMLSKHFSGQAFYERENVQKGIFLFDLDKFLSSGNLHDFSIA